MIELQIGFVFGCALLVCCVSLLIYLILDYRAMCRASKFDAPLAALEAAAEASRRALQSATPSTLTERRSRTTMPTPLYGERR